MGIIVLPPDINGSDAGFSIEKDAKSKEGKAIRFGFTAIKNVGTAAIDNILVERTGAGAYKSFTDFIARVDNQKVNKKVLESLIKVGAFDKFGKRSVILAEMERVRNKVGKSNSNTSQGGLFDNLVQEMDLVTDKWETDGPEFSSRELMEMERTLLGIYLREHPAMRTLKKVRDDWSTIISELDEKKNQKVTVVGVVKSIRIVMTKTKNEEMAFVALVDEGGEIDTVVFPKTFATVKSFLISNAVIKVRGRVDEREDRLSLVTESIEQVSEDSSVGDDPRVDPQSSDPNRIVVPKGTTKATLLELNKLLQSNRGEDHVTLIFVNGNGNRELALPFGINFTKSLQAKIADLIQIEKIDLQVS